VITCYCIHGSTVYLLALYDKAEMENISDKKNCRTTAGNRGNRIAAALATSGKQAIMKEGGFYANNAHDT